MFYIKYLLQFLVLFLCLFFLLAVVIVLGPFKGACVHKGVWAQNTQKLCAHRTPRSCEYIGLQAAHGIGP